MNTTNTATNGGQILTWQDWLREAVAASTPCSDDDVRRFTHAAMKREIADLRAALAAVPASEPVVPDNSEVPYLIVFDDQDQENELVIGDWRAAIRFKQISGSWNAHLFVKIAGNNRDDKTPCYAAAPAPISGMPDLASLQRDADQTIADKARDLTHRYFNGGIRTSADIWGLWDFVKATDAAILTTDTTNPTGETK